MKIKQYVSLILNGIKRNLAKVSFIRKDYENPEVHFFTIVINGMPFISSHIHTFNQLNFKWHWHIIEGMAAHVHDTAWSLGQGGTITDDMHRDGFSLDGTSEYIDKIVEQYPENVSVYRPTNKLFWDGKVEMCNTVLEHLPHQCLLWQIDVDEFWNASQIKILRDLFIAKPSVTAAWFYCNFFVGPSLRITSLNTYGNRLRYEWIRVWQYHRGMFWSKHEPPTLCMKTFMGPCDTAKINPIMQNETDASGLRFNHYAYVLTEQLTFKEKYYGYKNALQHWNKLQEQKDFPVYLKDFFPWVQDDAVVEKDSLNSFNVNNLHSSNDRSI